MDVKVGDIKITNPDKIIDGKTKKIDVIRYYEKVWQKMMPFLSDRYLSEIRCHNKFNDCFFTKHDKNSDSLLNISTLNDLIYHAQLGTIEFHTYAYKISKPTKPDIMVFDLDPDEKLNILAVREGVLCLKEVLDNLSLKSFVKTSGGKGYHIVVPFSNSNSWKNFEAFSQNLALYMEKTYPKLFTTTISKSARAGKIFIDYLRNKKGSTCVAPYSLRSRKNLPISMPISWKDVKYIKPNEVNIHNVDDFIKSNPWKDFYKLDQMLK